MKAYTGIRTPYGALVTTPEGHSLPLRLDLRDHSPTGFEWGYEGSGPAQLALALIAHCINDDVAEECYQDFKQKVIAALPDEWSMTPEQITDAIDEILADRG